MTHHKMLLIAGFCLLPLGTMASACAQEESDSITQEMESPSIAEYFTAADADGDGALNRDEYRIFVDALASTGDEAATAIRDGENYDESFASTDVDRDGLISVTEING